MRLSIKRPIGCAPTEDAAVEQTELARELRLGQAFTNVCGVALTYSNQETLAHVVAVVVTTRTWAVVHAQQATLAVARERATDFENFREAPLMLEVLTRLVVEPDVIFVAGHGIAHPRKFGVAAHVGLSLDHCTVGVAPLWPNGCVGPTVSPLGPYARRGSSVALRLARNGDVVGHQLHTQPEESPVYVSPGHRVGTDDATAFALRAAVWHRMPEPLHIATEMAEKLRGKG